MSIKNLQRAIKIIGSKTAVARLVGVNPSAVSNWLHRDERTPAAACKHIEKATKGKVTCYDLRPDIFLPPPDQVAANDDDARAIVGLPP